MKVRFENFQLIADQELYETMLKKYGAQSYGDDKMAIRTNNSFASWMIAEKVGDKYKITPISSQNNERQSLQMEAYWTVLKEFPIKEFSNVPQFYKQWFVNRGLMNEEKERDYKDEYKKFQSSKKMKKYRAELNKYNRDKGTYGNGDGKDASHKDGKIKGFEDESTNKGRREKSRLKKESTMSDQVDIGHGYTKDGNVIEFVIKKYAEGKWTTIDYDRKRKMIVAAGMTPESFLKRMKRVKLSPAEAGTVNKIAQKELKSPDNVMRNENLSWQEIQRALGYNAMGRDFGKVGESTMNENKIKVGSIVSTTPENLKLAKKYMGSHYDIAKKLLKNNNKFKVLYIDKEPERWSGDQQMVGIAPINKPKFFSYDAIEIPLFAIKENKMVITKTRLREIIMEEVQKLYGVVKEEKLNEDYDEVIAKSLIKSGAIKKGMSEKQMMPLISAFVKKEFPKAARRLLGYDEDFWSDTISTIYHYLKHGVKEEKLSEDKYPTKKDFEFIADQLVNVWEDLSEKEMVNHLYKQTKVNKKQLANAVKEWYSDVNFRRKYEMKPTKDIVRWLETHLVQFMAIEGRR